MRSHARCTQAPANNAYLSLAALERMRWDSNPRKPCDLNGFRDRPIRPLSHSSVQEASGFTRDPFLATALSPPRKERRERHSTLVGKNTLGDRDLVIEARVTTEVV